jgi:putative ATP-grasp target RiPP
MHYHSADPLADARRRIPLGYGTTPIEISDDAPSGPLTRPFGLRYVVEVTRDADNVVDIGAVKYDPVRQVSVIGGDYFIHLTTKQTVGTPYQTIEDMQRFPDTDPDTMSD